MPPLQVRSKLHVVLCFSPVGDMFRHRARRFAALVNCCTIDWFHAWPHSALISVAHRFLADVNLGMHEDQRAEVLERVVEFMAHAHEKTKVACVQYMEVEGRWRPCMKCLFIRAL